MEDKTGKSVDEGRRDFLAACGKFAITVPPAMTVLLSSSLSSPAIARSAGKREHKLRKAGKWNNWKPGGGHGGK
jgi:hypothetical protein